MLERLGRSGKEGTTREPVQTDFQQILAYFEELERLGTLVHIHTGGAAGMCLGARVQQVGEAERQLVLGFLHQLPRLDVGAEVELHFPLAGRRFKAPVLFEGRGDYMQCLFRLPPKIQFAERRMAMRARIGSREKASVAIFEGLSAGLAASGRMLNLSMEGLCMRVDRAVQLDGDRRLVPHPDLLHEGQRLQLVRILNLPHLPVLECSGEVRYARASQGGPVLVGIHLDGVGSAESHYLEQYMARRMPSFTLTFPIRRRKGVGGESDDGEPEEENPTETPTEDGGQDFQATEPTEDQDEGGASPEDRLLRIRRRGKRYLVLIPDDLDRSIFVCTMGVGGYPCAFEARSLVQALEHSKKVRMDVLFIDEQIGAMTGLEAARRLRKLGHLEDVPMFLLAKSPDVRLTLAAKAAGVTQVVRLPVDFDGTLQRLLDATFRLREQ